MLLIAVGLVAAALIVVPVLLFGVELIVLGVLLAGGLVGHVVLRKPWEIEAVSIDPLAASRQLEWSVRGWRRSGQVIEQVIGDLRAGRNPAEEQAAAMVD